MSKEEYSHELNDRVNLKIPEEIRTAMNWQGWNAFGIYELVRDEIELTKEESSVK